MSETVVKLTLVTALIFWVSTVVWAESDRSISKEKKILHAKYLLDVSSGELLEWPFVIVTGDRITAITQNRDELPADVFIHDLGSKTLLPGLMDMHTHLMAPLSSDYYAALFQSPHRSVIGGVVNAERTLMAGFTVVRDLGASDYQDVALRNAISAGEVLGPRMAVSGPALGITGGHCDDNSLNHGFNQRADGVADGPWGVRQQIRKNVKYGVDLIVC